MCLVDGNLIYRVSQLHWQATLDAINDGCNVTAHTTWGLLDDFEWTSGYTVPFGLHQVNFDVPERTRTPKASVAVLKNVVENRIVPPPAQPAPEIY